MKAMLSFKTCEFVSPGHPDKICDLIADLILDEYLKKDPVSRVAVEVMAGHGSVFISGEISSKAEDVDINKIAYSVLGEGFLIKKNIVIQSPEISAGVDTGGAGDQGIMIGYACDETESLMPIEYELARDLCSNIYNKYRFDGKVQVTLSGNKVETVVASFQNTPTDELEALVKENIKAERYLINPAGQWFIGGLDADSGLSGRKIVIDSYGPRVPVGGGSFSGKDFTKVDRSGAYMARKVAVDLLKKYKASDVLVSLAYAIGVSDPVMIKVLINKKEVNLSKYLLNNYDFSPEGIKSLLNLDNTTFSDLSSWGHFGRGMKWDI
jgi:S-adenosylmethionine synthetase